MFTDHKIPFDDILICTNPVSQMRLEAEYVQYYDKDGFELTPLEIEIYRNNGIMLNNFLYNTCCQKPWISSYNEDGLYLDHSMILQRYSFDGDILEQLKRHQRQVPELLRIMSTKPKWGIDFSLDYFYDNQVLDLFHIEYDSNSLDEIEYVKNQVTNIVFRTDWVDAAKTIIKRKSDWAHLEGHAQSDWKAQFFGFAKAEQVRKVL